MKGYNFRLQKLLDIRMDKEEQSKLKFKEAQVLKQNEEDKLSSLYDNYNKYKNEDFGNSVVERKIKLNYLNSVNQSINEVKEDLKQSVINLENKRKDLEQKQIDRKTVEILKEKKEVAFIKEQEMIEQKNNDEFALYSFIRRKASNTF